MALKTLEFKSATQRYQFYLNSHFGTIIELGLG